MTVLSFSIVLHEPVLATVIDGEPNSAVSALYLPGSLLRGALIHTYLANQQQRQLDAAGQRLFLGGTNRFLNGYPSLDNQRTLPTPLSWYIEKGGNADAIHDLASASFSLAPDVVYKRMERPFYSPADGENPQLIYATTPSRELYVHNERDKVAGRPTQRSGEIFRYSPLQSAQTFRAMILCDREEDADQLTSCLEGEKQLGRSHTVDYGAATFEDISREPAHSVVEAGTADTHIKGRIVVTLLSDVLLTNAWGQVLPDPELVAEALTPPGQKKPAKLLQAYQTTLARGGFNSLWGLALDQEVAISKGSVFELEIPEQNDTDTQSAWQQHMATCLQQGIGLRRAEGFGRLGIALQGQHPGYDIIRAEEQYLDTSAIEPREIAGEEALLLGSEIAKRMLRKRLDEALQLRVNTLLRTNHSLQKIPRTQMAHLRTAVKEALHLGAGEQAKNRLDKWVEDIKKRSATRSLFNRTKLAGQPFLRWIEERVKDEGESLREQLFVDDLPKIGANVVAELHPATIFEYNMRLIHDVVMLESKERGK